MTANVSPTPTPEMLTMHRPWVIIGTSGSHDYLNDTTSSKRFWLVKTPSSRPRTRTRNEALKTLRKR